VFFSGTQNLRFSCLTPYICVWPNDLRTSRKACNHSQYLTLRKRAGTHKELGGPFTGHPAMYPSLVTILDPRYILSLIVCIDHLATLSLCLHGLQVCGRHWGICTRGWWRSKVDLCFFVDDGASVEFEVAVRFPNKARKYPRNGKKLARCAVFGVLLKLRCWIVGYLDSRT
jgi:hypothetical protein